MCSNYQKEVTLVLLASTSQFTVSSTSTKEDYWGFVNSIGIKVIYDEKKDG